MSRICERCDRGPLSMVSRSHSNIATKRRQMVNLQWRKVDGKSIRLCTKCLKTSKKATV